MYDKEGIVLRIFLSKHAFKAGFTYGIPTQIIRFSFKKKPTVYRLERALPLFTVQIIRFPQHQIPPEHEDKQADEGQDCRTRLVRPNSQARTRTGKYSFSLIS